MAKKQKTLENQGDIFDLFEQADWEETASGGDRPDPVTLHVGDIIRFKKWNGTTVEGRFVTRGFWDGRDRENPQYYFVDCGGSVAELNPHRQEWVRLGHDESYRPPRKDNIAELLTEKLAAVPLTGRISAYQEFQKGYPYLSLEYSTLVDEAWNTALCEITTEEEVMANQKHWSYIGKLPGFLKDYIEQAVFPLSGMKRMEALWSLRWVETSYGHHFVRYLPDKQCTYFKELFLKLICETENISVLQCLARLWGPQSYRTKDEIPGLFWKQQERNIEVLIPREGLSLLPEPEEEPEENTPADTIENFEEEWELIPF